MFSQPEGLTAAVRYTLQLQAQKVADRLVSQKSSTQKRSKRKGAGRSRKSKISSCAQFFFMILQNIIVVVIPIILIIFISQKIK
jgi:hypothetical protein